MSITKISSTRNVTGLINYISESESHKKGVDRYVSINSNNCSINNAKYEFNKILEIHNKKNNIQGHSIIVSWSKEELNPESEEDIKTAQEVLDKLAIEVGGEDRQSVSVVQIDGAGGCLHGHIALNSVDMKTGKSLRGKYTGHGYLKERCDEIQKEMGILNKNLEKNEYTEQRTIGEIKRKEQNKYVWKDDLKERIESCVNNEDIDDIEKFINSMEQDYNVIVDVKKSRTEEAYKGYVLTYKFKDKTGKERKSRQKKLGSRYGLKGVNYGITENRNNKRELEKSQRTNTNGRDKGDIDELTERLQRIQERQRERIRVISVNDFINPNKPKQRQRQRDFQYSL